MKKSRKKSPDWDLEPRSQLLRDGALTTSATDFTVSFHAGDCFLDILRGDGNPRNFKFGIENFARLAFI